MHEVGQRFVVMINGSEAKGRVVEVLEGPPKRYIIKLLDGGQIIVTESQVLQKQVL